jgi:hypothetical protein
VAKALWNPIGLPASVIGGVLFGVFGSVAASILYHNWWYLLTAIPAAAVWVMLWRYYYPRMNQTVRSAFERRGK